MKYNSLREELKQYYWFIYVPFDVLLRARI